MELLFFKPGFHSKNNDVEDLMKYLKEISLFVEDIVYSPIIEKVMIGPIIAPEEEIKNGKWEEVIKCWPKSHDASISKHIDYNLFVNSSYKEKSAINGQFT